MTYWSLFLILFVAGVLFWPLATRQYAIMFAVLLIAAIPTGLIFEPYIMRYGVFAHFGVLLGVAAGGFGIAIARLRFDRELGLLALFAILFVLLVISNHEGGINFTRDMRAYLMLAIALSASLFVKNIIVSLRGDRLIPLLKAAVLVAFLKIILLFFLVRYFNLNASFTDDPFLVSAERANQWYGDLSTYLAVAWLLCFARRHPLIDLLSFAMILASGSRTILAIILIIYIASMRINKVNLSLTVLVLLMSSWMVIERLLDETAGGVWLSILIRFAPFIESLDQMSGWEVLVGHGFGHAFEIPWFEYRDLDNTSNFIDSFYLTLFAKFGILSLAIMIMMFKVVMPLLGSSKKFAWYFVLGGLTTALVYQSTFPLALFVFSLFYQLSLKRING